MNVGLVLASGELSIVEAVIVVIVFFYGPFWIYKQWSAHQVQKMLWDRIVNSWFFKHESKDFVFEHSSYRHYYPKYDIDPEKSIKIYDEEECDRSRSLRSQYENYRREAIYLPHLFGDKDYCDGFIIGKYGPNIIKPWNMTGVHDYMFASLTKDAIWRHVEKLIGDNYLCGAISEYIDFAMERHHNVSYEKAPITFCLMKRAEKYANQLIYMDRSTVDEFKKVCKALTVVSLSKITEISDVEEFMGRLKKKVDIYGDDLHFYVESYQYISELISKEGIITAEPVQAVPDPEEPDAAPVQSDAEGEFAEQILAELIEEGFTGDELLSEFKKRQAKVRPAVESVFSEAKEIAHGRGAYSTYEDVFGAGEKQR